MNVLAPFTKYENEWIPDKERHPAEGRGACGAAGAGRRAEQESGGHGERFQGLYGAQRPPGGRRGRIPGAVCGGSSTNGSIPKRSGRRSRPCTANTPSPQNSAASRWFEKGG